MLEPLTRLLGTWTIEARHPAYPGTVVPGRAVFEWLDGEQFLTERSETDHPDFPNSLSVIGAGTNGFVMHYFDSRGVHRVYEMAVTDGIWTIWRDEAGFLQRFTGTFEDDGDAISGLWRLSRDGFHWADDLEIAFRRVP